MTTTNLNAMPTVSQILLSPFKVITKPLQWWLYGWENKTGEYKIEVTYNLEFEGKPLVITKAINCEIFEGKGTSPRDGIKRPTRKAKPTVGQITYKIAETNEVIILPMPYDCKVDEAYKEEFIPVENGKPKLKIIPIANETKSFIALEAQYIPSISIAKLDENDNIINIKRVISPKYYQQANARIKWLSIEAKDGSNLEAVKPKDEMRFGWIDGKNSRNEYPWGNYKEQDKGVYAAFGMFVLPQDIWSKIPKINDFVSKVAKENVGEEFLSLSERGNDGAEEVIAELRRVTFGERYSLRSFVVGRFGINDIEPWIAIFLAKGTDIRKKGEDKKMFVPKEREKEWQELVKKSNYRDYYQPFVFDEKDRLWKIDGSGWSGMIIKKIDNGKAWKLDNSSSQEFHATVAFRMNDENYNPSADTTGNLLFYNAKTKEIIFPSYGQGIYLK